MNQTIILTADGAGCLLPWPTLAQAELCFEAKDYVGCAAWLREAITLRLDVMLHRYDVKPPQSRGRKRPKSKRGLTPKFKVELLQKAKALDPGGASWVTDAIDACNKLIHLCFVPASRISFALTVARLLLDESDDPIHGPRLLDDSPLSRGGVEGGAI